MLETNNGEKTFKGEIEMMETFNCVLCEKPMLPSSEIVACSFCLKREKADYVCPDGHYVCEECRVAAPDKIVKKTCEVTQGSDPMKIAILLMKHPAIQMHGPEHHYLVSCSLLAALRNLNRFEIDGSAFDQAISRGKRILLGSCGLWGACGAAVGLGIAVSTATKAAWTSDKERSLSMQAPCEALSHIAKIGGPRCCKASVFAATEAAAAFFEREFTVKFPSLEDPRPCHFRAINMECLRGKCPYWR